MQNKSTKNVCLMAILLLISVSYCLVVES